MVLQGAGRGWPLIVIGLLLCTAGTAKAQHDDDKIESDRPDQTEASSVIPKGTVQIETGYNYQKDRIQEKRVTTHAYPTATVRIGVFEGVEFRLVGGIRDSVVENGTRRRVSGFGPLNLGAKVKLWSGAGWIPDAALIARVTLPTGTKGLSPNKPGPHLRLILKNELTGKLDLGYNLLYSREEGKSVPAYTTSVSYELSDRLTFFAEVFGQKAAGEEAQHQADAGFLFFVLPRLQLDVAVGRYLTENAPDFFMTGGVSVRLPR